MSVPASERPLTLTVYNPDLLNKEDLIRGFVARKTLLVRLLGDVRRETRDDTPSQPYLILGQRGLGKTTLLRRLAYGIEDDPDLGAAWVPLVFPEEQYNIATLSDFWLNCVDALGDAIERGGDPAAYRALDARVEGMPRAEPERRRQALALLLAEADRLGKRLMLLIDNIDIVFDRLGDKDDWEFRRILSAEPRLLLIGASSRALEAVYDYGRPFYDYFQVHELKGLDEAETFELLQALAEQTGQSAVAELLNRHPARVRTLRLLTGGNPRTLVVLFRILAQSPDGEVDRDLEQLLDLHTPLYKARFEELSTQSQQVVDAMAIHWDPLSAVLLAETARLPVNQVSAQLQRLEDSGVVEKTEWYGEKKAAYQIAERFFNIWYLMRASRRVRRKLIWLVKFLEIWFDQEELRTRAQAYLRKAPDSDRQRYAERAFAYAQAIKHRPLSTALEHAGLHALIDDETVRRLIDFSDLPPELQDKRLRMERMRELHEQVRTVALDWAGIDREEFWRLLGGSPRYSLEEKAWTMFRLPGLTPTELRTLFESLQRQHQRILDVYQPEAAVVEKLYDALAGGDMADVYDVEAATAIAGNEGYPLLPYVAVRARVSSWLTPETLPEGEVRQAEAALRRMMEQEPLEAKAWNGLGNLLSDRSQRYDEAEQAYRKAIELEPQNAWPWNNLGVMLSEQLQRYDEAEQAYRKAIELEPQNAWPWNNLGVMLSEQLQRYEEAKQAYRRAIELEPQNAWTWSALGVLLSNRTQRYVEAEQCFRHAIALDTQFAFAWHYLGILLAENLQRYEEAEQAYRKAIELEPQNAWPWNNLGVMLSEQLQRYEEAEETYRRAIELDPQNAWVWRNLGFLLSDHFQRHEEAEQAYRRAIELDSRNAWVWENLGGLLQYRLRRHEEGAAAFLQALELAKSLSDARLGLLEACGALLADTATQEQAVALVRRGLDLLPDDAGFKATLAQGLALTGQWPEARGLLSDIAQGAEWELSFTSLFASIVATDHAKDALAVLEQAGAHESWRPLYEALRAAAEGSAKYLRRVAPEVRVVAEKILREIAPHLYET